MNATTKPTPSAGYSTTPLARKLGIVAGTRILGRQLPEDYRQLLEPLSAGVVFARQLSRRVDLIHVFATRKSQLLQELTRLRPAIRPDAAVWVSWPKQASRVPTDISDQVIREVALPLGFVDIKVCAVSDVWSGLKLVIRKELRAPARK